MGDVTPIGDSVDDWQTMCDDAAAKAPPFDEDAYAAQLAADREAQRQWEIERAMSVFHREVPKRLAGARWDDLDSELQQTLGGRWHGNMDRRNVLLLGAVGRGKTHTAVAMLHEAAQVGYTVGFAPIVDLMASLRPGGDATIERWVKPDLLVLDDLGGEKASDWTTETLYRIVNGRWLAERPIIATSNLDLAALRAHVGERTLSRLRHDAVGVEVGGADRRIA